MTVWPHCNDADFERRADEKRFSFDDELELYCGFFGDIVVNQDVEGVQFNERDEDDRDDR